MITMTSNSTFPGPSPDVPTVQPDIGIPYYVGETILAFCAFLSNSLVILLFSLERKLRVTVSNVHLISLAISDFCMGTVAIPILLVTLQGYPHEFPACITLLSLVVLIAIASVFALLTMTLDRYYSITHPLQYSVKVTKTRASFTALLAWLFACLLVLPMPLGWHHKPSQPQCFFTEVVSMQYMTFIFFVCILTPFVVMCTVYIRLYVIIQKQLKQLQAIHDTCRRLQGLSVGEETSIVVQTGRQFHLDRIDEGGATSQTPPTVSHLDNFHRIKREIKTAGIFAFLMLFFFISWMPIFVVDVLLYFQVNIDQGIINGCVLLSHANSAFNPLLYTLKADFRAEFWRRIRHACLTHRTTNTVGPFKDTKSNSQRYNR